MFKDNIDAGNSIDQQNQQRDLDNMVAEGKRLGLEPEDLGVGEKDDATFATKQKDPLNTDKKTGLDEPDDEQPVPKATEKKEKAASPKADEEEDDSEDEEESEDGDEGKEDESAEGKDEGKPSADSKKFVTKSELRIFGKGIRNGFKELAESIEKLAEAKSPAEKKEAQAEVAAEVDDFMGYAQKYKDAEGNPMNADALKELAGIIEKQVLGKVPLEQIKGLTDLQPQVTKLSDDMTREEIQSVFNTEWESEGTKFIKEKYPNATPEQVAKAKTKIFDLATSEKYGQVEGKHDAYPLDYIFMKEAEAMKDILYSPRKKTAEGSQLGDEGDSGDDEGQSVLGTPFSQMTPAKAKAMEEELGKADNDDMY